METKVASSRVDEGKTSRLWELTRPTEPIQNLFNLYNEFGAQSNLVCAATYHNTSGESTLRPSLLLPVLRKIIQEHYTLAIIPVEQPSKASKKKHRLWEARLAEIDVEQLVEYVDLPDADTAVGMRRLIEETHHEWLEPDDKSHPRWKVKVVNGRHLLFVFDHFIADGLSGYAFHRSVLKALITVALDEKLHDWSITPPKLEPPARWNTDFPVKASILYMIIIVVKLKFLRFFFSSWLWCSDAKVNRKPDPYEARLMEGPRCRTSIYGIDLTAEEQNALVQGCKNHGATYGAMFHTLTVATLAADIYPNARIGRSVMLVSLRRFAKPPQSLDVMTNSAASLSKNFWSLTNFRSAVKATTALSGRFDPGQLSPVNMDLEAVVSLAKAYTKDLNEGIASNELFHPLLAFELAGEDKQDLYKNTFPNLPLFSRNAVTLSNLGPFDPATGPLHSNDSWTITDIQFSASATISKYGSAGPVLNITSVKGGACHVNVVLETGVLPDAMMETFVARLKQRLLLFAKLGGQTE